MKLYPVYRLPEDNDAPSQYPANAMRLISPKVENERYLVGFHFKHRARPNGRKSTRAWIAEYRRTLRACGYNAVAKQLNNLKGA